MKKILSILFIYLLFTIPIISGLFNGVNAQESKIVQLSGFVKNSKLQPLPYAHILIKNTHRGTISNFSGYFSLAVQTNDIIIFSSVGYKKGIFIVPDIINSDNYSIVQILKRDTIMLGETIIYPWQTYKQFKEAFLNLNIPDDDIERAKKNLALQQLQHLMAETPMDGSLNYKNFMQQHYDKMYYAGQYPPINILNPFAWAAFFKALKDGDFKKKK